MTTLSEIIDPGLVSIVTPHIPGREEQLYRCMDAVFDLRWPSVQHVIVSDRTAEQWTIEGWHAERLQETIDILSDADHEGVYSRWLTFVQINESWRNPTTEASIGAIPWHIGSLLALGEFIGFCGDDDELLPDHVRRHVEAMREHEAMFSVSRIQFRANGVDQFIVGDAFAHGQLDATGIMCHRDALVVANWSADGTNAADWRLVRDWLAAGLRGHLIGGEPTGIHNDGWLVGKTGRPDRPQ